MRKSYIFQMAEKEMKKNNKKHKSKKKDKETKKSENTLKKPVSQ